MEAPITFRTLNILHPLRDATGLPRYPFQRPFTAATSVFSRFSPLWIGKNAPFGKGLGSTSEPRGLLRLSESYGGRDTYRKSRKWESTSGRGQWQELKR